MKQRSFKLLFFGSDEFSTRILNHLLSKDLCPISVVTGPFSLLDAFSSKNKIDTYRWPIRDYNHLRSSFNIGLIASFGRLIDAKTIESFRYGLFNVHPSLLPKYRGSSPIQNAILNDDRVTGCTIMKIPPIEKFDIGDIVLQQKLEILHREYAKELRDRLADAGALLMERLLLDFDVCMAKAIPQTDEDKSYAKKIKPERGHLKFRSQTSNEIDRTFRALYGFIDLYITCLEGLSVKLADLRDPVDSQSLNIDQLIEKSYGSKEKFVPVEAGSIYFHKTRRLLCIKSYNGDWLAFGSATPESKPRMTALEFYNGYLSKLSQGQIVTNE